MNENSCEVRLIGHHACRRSGGRSFVRKNAPFLSEYIEIEGKVPYLGTGYYFWDDNEDLALWWGKSHYENTFYVVESEIVVPEGLFFDLVGKRSHMRLMGDFIAKLRKRGGYDRSEWKLAQIIEFLKVARLEDDSIAELFPFEVIRAADASGKLDLEDPVFFSPNKKGVVLLNPRIMICIFGKKELYLQQTTILNR
jgi:hypothetical protein